MGEELTFPLQGDEGGSVGVAKKGNRSAMPVTYTIDEALVRLHLEGDHKPEEVTARFLEALSDPDCPPVAALLLDLSRTEALSERSAHEIRYVAQFAGRHADRMGGRVAVVVASDLDYNLTKMGAIFSAAVGLESKIFRNEGSALYWLGVEGADSD
jgi:hypothetical protein